jgi:hypothetical protein
MSFSLCFSPEFFFNKGEPYDYYSYVSNRPTSVWQAVLSVDEQEWKSMAKEVFDIPPDQAHLLTPEAVMDKIIETDTCTDLSGPVEVWIDKSGYFSVKVYDRCEQ